MPSNKRSKGLSETTRALLASGEGAEVDFKKIADGIGQDDLVAFANSKTGGQILVGVAEEVVNGAQVGVVCGCDVSDGTLLQITNKAVTCLPPVSIEIAIENLDQKPILRISIPSSATKPHCTARGIYNRRDGVRNRPLHPTELLGIFLDTESRAFSRRFEAAADRITSDLANLESSLDDSIKSMSNQLGWAESQLSDTESSIDEILRHMRTVDSRTGDISKRMRSLFLQDERDDPVRKRELGKLANRLLKQIDERQDLLDFIKSGGELEFNDTISISEELTKEDGEKALKIARDFIHDREDKKNYSVSVKAPKKFSKEELKDFCSIVAEGGEVADRLSGRIEEAFRLGFISYKGKIVGTAALKKPKVSYRAKVFVSADCKKPAAEYPYELGWIYLQQEHRQKGQMTRLINALMPLAKGSGLFATTRTANQVMREMLMQLKFESERQEYPSVLRADEKLQLFLLAPRLADAE